MNNKEEILKELREIAPTLALLEKTTPYKVPDDYFLAFKNSLLEQLKSEAAQELNAIAPELAKLNKPVTEGVPANYFSSFSGDLMKKIRAAEVQSELQAIAPELSKLEKENVYEVPATYFSSLPLQILNKVQAEQKIQRAPSPSPVEEFLTRIAGLIFKPRHAVAFSGFATLVIVGMLFFIKVEQCADLECRFAQLSSDDINTYLNEHPDFNSDQIIDDAGSASGTISFSDYKEALKDIDDAALNEAIED